MKSSTGILLTHDSTTTVEMSDPFRPSKEVTHFDMLNICLSTVDSQSVIIDACTKVNYLFDFSQISTA